MLHRSIYDVAVYTSFLDFEGSFAAPDIGEVVADAQAVRWRDAVLAVAVSDVSGLKEAASLNIDGSETLSFEPSIGVPATRVDGIHVRLASAAKLFAAAGAADAPPAGLNGFDFKFSLTLNGSSELTFAPVAQQTTVALTSDWRDPSFMGAFLPNDRVLNPASFAARWQIPHLARSVPQSWSLGDQELERMPPYAFGVRFIVPVDFYQLVSRAAKYAMMFLATAFMAVFLLEIGSPRQVHPVQYLFVGLTMIFFYVLLLSLAEQIGFLWAYLIAAVATGGLLSLYVWRAQQSLNKGLVMAGVFFVLYGLLYLILQMEDYALLAGAIAGFVMLAVVMFSTLHVDWSGQKRTACIGSPKRARSTSRPLPVPAGTARPSSLLNPLPREWARRKERCLESFVRAAWLARAGPVCRPSVRWPRARGSLRRSRGLRRSFAAGPNDVPPPTAKRTPPTNGPAASTFTSVSTRDFDRSAHRERSRVA